MKRKPTAAVTAALLLIAFVPALPSDSVRGFAPDTAKAGNATLHGKTWTEEGPGYALRLQAIDDAQRLAYIRHVTGHGIDPFASPPGRVSGFLSFVLEIENKGEGDISFNPQTCWMVTSRKRDLQSPFGLDRLSFEYSVSGRELPPAYRRVAPALLEQARTVSPGQSVSGLLIYKAVHPRTRWFHVDAVLSLPGGDIVRFSAPYRRAPTSKEASEP